MKTIVSFLLLGSMFIISPARLLAQITEIGEENSFITPNDSTDSLEFFSENYIQYPPINLSEMGNILGVTSEQKGNNVWEFAFPRRDLFVILSDGTRLYPGFNLTSKVKVLPIDDNQVMLFGELVATHEEVGALETELRSRGILVSAINNHLLGENPRIAYLHFAVTGAPEDLATKLRTALETTRTPLGAEEQTADSITNVDTGIVNQIFGLAGQMKGGTYQITIPRNNNFIAPIEIFFQSANNDADPSDTLATGEIPLLRDEIEGVTDTLTESGILVTAPHTHLLDTDPQLFYIHFLARGTVTEISNNLLNTLRQTNNQTGQ